MNELASAGRVLPIPWKTLELTKMTPLSTKFQLMMRRYSAPKATTAASALKNRTMSSGETWQRTVTINIRPALMRAAA